MTLLFAGYQVALGRCLLPSRLSALLFWAAVHSVASSDSESESESLFHSVLRVFLAPCLLTRGPLPRAGPNWCAAAPPAPMACAGPHRPDHSVNISLCHGGVDERRSFTPGLNPLGQAAAQQAWHRTAAGAGPQAGLLGAHCTVEPLPLVNVRDSGLPPKVQYQPSNRGGCLQGGQPC